MKKSYISPTTTVIEMSVETRILAESGNRNQFDIGMSNEEMNGSEALSNKKNDSWGTEDYWK